MLTFHCLLSSVLLLLAALQGASSFRLHSRESRRRPEGKGVEPAEETDVTSGRQSFLPSASGGTTDHLGSWGDHTVFFLIGCVFLTLSIPILWVNEGRRARMEGLVYYGRAECRSVSGLEAAKENRNCLVHMEGEYLRSAAQVSDEDFGIVLDGDCVRLKRSVQVFQVIEQRTKSSAGGGGGVMYTYTEEWSSSWHDSNNYHDPAKRINIKPNGLEPGTRTVNCGRVECAGFVLPPDLVEQCGQFRSAANRLGNSITFQKVGSLTFGRQGDFYCHSRSGLAAQNAPPKVGDMRVRFEYAPEVPVSIMALQVEGRCPPPPGDSVETAKEAKDSFLPYRVIHRSLLGLSEDEEKQRRRVEAEKSGKQLSEEATVTTGPFCFLCCVCNLVAGFAGGRGTPEIFHLFQGSKAKGEMLDLIKARTLALAWVGRLAGWLSMFIGLYFLFSPLLGLISLLPVIGPLLKSAAGSAIWLLCFSVTLLLSTMIASLACLAYRPGGALLYMTTVAVVIALPLAVGL